MKDIKNTLSCILSLLLQLLSSFQWQTLSRHISAFHQRNQWTLHSLKTYSLQVDILSNVNSPWLVNIHDIFSLLKGGVSVSFVKVVCDWNRTVLKDLVLFISGHLRLLFLRNIGHNRPRRSDEQCSRYLVEFIWWLSDLRLHLREPSINNHSLLYSLLMSSHGSLFERSRRTDLSSRHTVSVETFHSCYYHQLDWTVLILLHYC